MRKFLILLCLSVPLFSLGCRKKKELPPAPTVISVQQAQDVGELSPVADVSNEILVNEYNPVELSLTGISASQTKKEIHFRDVYECVLDETAFGSQGLFSLFENQILYTYTFTPEEESKDFGPYALTVLQNMKDYGSLEEFQEDFAACSSERDLNPYLLNEDWLVFEAPCEESTCKLFQENMELKFL